MRKLNAWRRERRPTTYLKLQIHLSDLNLLPSFMGYLSLLLCYAIKASSIWCDLVSLICQIMVNSQVPQDYFFFFGVFCIFLQWLNCLCRCWQMFRPHKYDRFEILSFFPGKPQFWWLLFVLWLHLFWYLVLSRGFVLKVFKCLGEVSDFVFFARQ